MPSDEFKTRCGILIRAIGKTLSSLSLYTLKHPSVANAIAENHAALELLLREAGGEITLSIDKEALLANGQVVAAAGQAPPALLNFFKRYELHGVTFLPGVSLDELSWFLSALTLKKEALEGKSLPEFLEARGVRQIRPNAAVYVKMEKGAAPAAAPVAVPGAPAGGAGAEGEGGGPDWTKIPLEEAIRILVEKAVADPWERTQVIEALKERLRQEIAERVDEATRKIRSEKTRLANEKQRTDVILNNMAEAVVVVDESGNVLVMNPAAEQLYGKRFTELAGKPLLSSVKSEELLVSLSGQIATPSEAPVSEKLVAAGEENASRALRASSAVVRNEEGAVVGMVSGLPDVAKFREYQRLQDEFVAQVTHELRSPLTSITAALSLLADQFAGKLNKDEDRVLQLASRNADRLAGLINEMLDFSKLQAGQMTVHPKPLEVRKQVKEASDSLEPWARRQGLTLQVAASEALPLVFADPKRMTQVLVNLISNAIKFSPKGAAIEVSATRDAEDAGFLRFAVADHGPGMTPEETARLFEKFVQLMAGEQTVGTGLGLSIAKALVHLQKGRIWVDSAKGRGTTFFFTLPVFRPEMIGEAPKQVVAPPPPPKTWWRRLFG